MGMVYTHPLHHHDNIVSYDPQQMNNVSLNVNLSHVKFIPSRSQDLVHMLAPHVSSTC